MVFDGGVNSGVNGGNNGGEISRSFRNSMLPYELASAKFNPRKACMGYFQMNYGGDGLGVVDSNGGSHVMGDEEDDDGVLNEENVAMLLWILIPMVVVAALLLLVLMSCVCCYMFGSRDLATCCKRNNNKPSKPESPSLKESRKNNIPVIFANELSQSREAVTKRVPYPPRPILGDQVCPRTPPPSYSHAVSSNEFAHKSQRLKGAVMERSFSPSSQGYFLNSRVNSSEESSANDSRDRFSGNGGVLVGGQFNGQQSGTNGGFTANNARGHVNNNHINNSLNVTANNYNNNMDNRNYKTNINIHNFG